VFRALKLLNEKISTLQLMEYRPHSELLTEDIWIICESTPSNPIEESRYRFDYTITITNFSPTRTHQLLTRHWDILSSDGRKIEVDGDGVVGHQPILGPGETWKYESHCFLETYHGVMSGWFGFMDKQEGRLWKAFVAPFGLFWLNCFLLQQNFAEFLKPL